MTSSRLRVLVVEDSLTIRKRIVEILREASDVEAVYEAADGKAAIEACERYRPNVVTMDMMLPTMTGLAATEYIMAYCPTPILIVSASVNRGELFRTYDALAAGAVDVLDKPLGVEPDDTWAQRLVAAVRMTARVRVITHPRARLARTTPPSAPHATHSRPAQHAPSVVAIGASTGGPGALLTLLGGLPASFPLPILLVLHISEPFGAAMAHWLDGALPFTVRYAVHGERLPPRGECLVLMAPAGRHLVVDHGALRLVDDPERNSCKPSVDVLFESLATDMASRTVACLLTGMGKDGAAGLLAIRQRGGLTFAQDEATSVIFGMPGEAVRIGAADRVLPLPQFAPELTAAATVRGKPA